MGTVEMIGIEKIYENGFHALHDLNLRVEDGEFLVLVGPSGCGKSTALRLVSGLESISEGTIVIGGRDVGRVDPKNRDIAMVFQNYALYPHMTVYENISFPLKLAKVDRSEIERRVRRVAVSLELTECLGKRPGQLSGGQRQRVAMGRAIVRQPAVFLMDEPLSNLDAKLRVQMRAEIAELQRRLGVTTIYVTHDQVEAMTMGDRVAVLKDGYLQQVDSPARLYERPVNLFVGEFIGSPAMNVFRARLEHDGVCYVLRLGTQIVRLPPKTLTDRPALRDYSGKELVVGIRPEDLEDADLVSDGRPVLYGTVGLVEALGSEYVVHLKLDACAVTSDGPDGASDNPAGMNAVGRFATRSRVRAGAVCRIAVSSERLHFFDCDTRASIWA